MNLYWLLSTHESPLTTVILTTMVSSVTNNHQENHYEPGLTTPNHYWRSLPKTNHHLTQYETVQTMTVMLGDGVCFYHCHSSRVAMIIFSIPSWSQFTNIHHICYVPSGFQRVWHYLHMILLIILLTIMTEQDWWNNQPIALQEKCPEITINDGKISHFTGYFPITKSYETRFFCSIYFHGVVAMPYDLPFSAREVQISIAKIATKADHRSAGGNSWEAWKLVLQ